MIHTFSQYSFKFPVMQTTPKCEALFAFLLHKCVQTSCLRYHAFTRALLRHAPANNLRPPPRVQWVALDT